MTKRAVDKIVAGLRDAAATKSGEASSSTDRVHVLERVDVKAIRSMARLTQVWWDASPNPLARAGSHGRNSDGVHPDHPYRSGWTGAVRPVGKSEVGVMTTSHPEWA
jgi:hypothetical protein